MAYRMQSDCVVSDALLSCHCAYISMDVKFQNEPQREKTNNVDFNQVWQKPGCTATGDG